MPACAGPFVECTSRESKFRAKYCRAGGTAFNATGWRPEPRSRRPHQSDATAPAITRRILQLRRRRLGPARIAVLVRISAKRCIASSHDTDNRACHDRIGGGADGTRKVAPENHHAVPRRCARAFRNRSVRALDEFHAAPGARRARKSTVARQHDRIEHFSKRYVHGVVGAQVVSKRPHSIEERLVRVALEIQRAKILTLLPSDHPATGPAYTLI